VFLASLTLVVLADRVDACERITLAMAQIPKPAKAAVMAAGVIEGYDLAVQPVDNVASAPSLRVRINEVVVGNIARGTARVVLLFYGPDCKSAPYQRERLEEMFPVGLQVVVSGRNSHTSGASAEPAIVAEMNRDEYVGRLPAEAPRTDAGDLDFRHFEPTPDGAYDFLRFEVTRVLIKVPEGTMKQRVARLENLIYFQEFAFNSRARDLYDHAIQASGVTRSQGRTLREHFEQVWKTR
jgi:hypothetical protein